MARRGGKTGGRPKGTPNRITRSLREMIEQALTQAGGAQYLEAQAQENPAAFMALLGKILPLQVTGDAERPLIIVTRAE